MMIDNSLITTEWIIEDIVGGQGLEMSDDGHNCNINLYSCDLEKDYVHELFGFEIDTSLSALFPDIYINVPIGTYKDIYEHEIRYSYTAYSFLQKLIPEKVKMIAGAELASVTFSILHEIGHWKHFCDLNYNPIEYCEYDALERNNFLQLYGDNLESCEALKKYRDISSEKAADKYALSNIQSSLEFIINKNI